MTRPAFAGTGAARALCSASPSLSPWRASLIPTSAARLALLALLLSALLAAFTPIFVRVSEVGPTATVFWRLALSLPVLWTIMRVSERRPVDLAAPLRVRGVLFILLTAVIYVINVSFWHLSIVYTSVANASLLVNAHPVFVVLGAWLFYRERMTARFIAGLGLSLIGVVLLMRASATEIAQVSIGDVFALLSAAFFAGWILCIKHLRRTLSPATLLVWNHGLSLFLVLPIALLLGETVIAVTLAGWLLLFAFAMLVNVFSHIAFTYATGHIPVSLNSLILLIVPVLSAALGWALLDEAVSGIQFGAGACVLAGIALGQQGWLAGWRRWRREALTP